tara:strand:+ start:608 stop:1066 length:459 start_codon:yes stop_codon:yes gene_type:complete
MTYTIRHSQRKDCATLSKHTRAADVQEIFASSGKNPFQVLLRAYFASPDYCYTVLLEDKIVGMFGISKITDGVGSPWLLGSNLLLKAPLSFHRKSKKYLDTFMKDFKVLFNYVDKRNVVAIKWLKGLGFTFTKLVDNFGYQQKPFYEFVKVR